MKLSEALLLGLKLRPEYSRATLLGKYEASSLGCILVGRGFKFGEGETYGSENYKEVLNKYAPELNDTVEYEENKKMVKRTLLDYLFFVEDSVKDKNVAREEVAAKLLERGY